MSDAPETPIEPTVVATSVQESRPNRLNHVAAWVGIVAGIVFIIAAVFFSGVYAGKTYSDRYRDGRAANGSCPMMGGGMMAPGGMPGGMMPPGGMPPGMMPPGMMGPGGKMGPGQQVPTTSPAAPTTPRS